MEENLVKQGFLYDTSHFSEPYTNAATVTGENLLEETKFTTKAVEELSRTNVHLKASEVLYKRGVTDTSSIRPLATLLV